MCSKNILITGATGQLASAIIEKFAEEKNVTVFAATSHPEHVKQKPENVQVIKNSAIEACLRANEMDYLIHAAFPRNVADHMWAAGIEFGYKVFSCAHRHKVKHIIHISSQSLYGWKREQPAVEGDPVVLSNPYSTGKYCLEQVVNAVFQNIPHTNLRLSTIIGPRSEEKVVNKFVRKVHEASTTCSGSTRGGTSCCKEEIRSFPSSM